MRYLTALGTADLLDELALEFDGYFVPSDDRNEIRALAVEAVADFDESYGGARLDRFDNVGGT